MDFLVRLPARLHRWPLLGRAFPSQWRAYRLRHLIWTLLFCYLGWNLWIFSYIAALNWMNPDTTRFMQEQLDRLQDDDPDASLSYQWVPYEKISRQMKRALLVAEDARFAEHNGFDWDGIQTAFEKNLKRGRIVAGGSTISQQLAKNLFLSSSRTPWRKAEEALITLMLEGLLKKQRIYEIYLNVIEWGDGVFGVEAASRRYYRVHASQLSAPQAAHLAAMVTNPRYYEDHQHDRHLQFKTGIILKRMSQADLPQADD